MKLIEAFTWFLYSLLKSTSFIVVFTKIPIRSTFLEIIWNYKTNKNSPLITKNDYYYVQKKCFLSFFRTRIILDSEWCSIEPTTTTKRHTRNFYTCQSLWMTQLLLLELIKIWRMENINPPPDTRIHPFHF